MAPHSQEESYSLEDAVHDKGTNRYIFEYSPHWRRIVDRPLSISIRSVKMWLSNRTIYIDGLCLCSNDEGTGLWNISPHVILSGTMKDLNDELVKDRHNHYELFSSSGGVGFTEQSYEIKYNQSKGSLYIGVATTGSNYLWLDYQDATYVSNDFKMITGLTDDQFWLDLAFTVRGEMGLDKFEELWGTNKVILECDDDLRVTKITFNNIWDRCTVRIAASFVDLAGHQYLGITNEQFIPPKEYSIVNGDQKFYLDLFSLDGKPLELPSDQKDQLVIEAIMNAY